MAPRKRANAWIASIERDGAFEIWDLYLANELSFSQPAGLYQKKIQARKLAQYQAHSNVFPKESHKQAQPEVDQCR